MPQLVKGGKWVYGWVIVGRGRELPIPPDAWYEYGFCVGDVVMFVPGSQRSGGFALCHARLLAGAAVRLQKRALAQGCIAEPGMVSLPPEVAVRPGDCLLAVRGSGRGLGFVAQGPIFQEALGHPELVCFDPP